MRKSSVAAFLLASMMIGLGSAAAAECPQGALGVSRTIAVDPADHPRVGSMQYPESLPLRDHEVVLTFDDGPLPPYTTRILDTLASECVKATFFMVGRMVRGYPALVRRIYSEGHTVANHSQTHPFTFHKMTVEHAQQEIEQAHASLLSALGDEKAISPFFRVPGLLRQDSVEQWLAAHHYMTWSVDFLADDWTHINNKEVAKRAINRIEARGRGILLLHDIQPATALAFPEILRELKVRGYKIVHVVPATADQPKTAAEPELWAARHSREDKIWPRTVVMSMENALPVLAAPAPQSFGIENFGRPSIRIALAQTFESQLLSDGQSPLTSMPPWPQQVAYSIPAEEAVLPAPAAYNFRYSRPYHLGDKSRGKKGATATANAGKTKDGTGGTASSGSRPRAVGHQLTVMRPIGLWPWR